ncbi:GTPase HflX [Botrimarina hoheduenensis]|uniref:GTPase HflX n=1 Tax=Botrimarina hoheduenensis TaxID=2528000 RepID=A0A5C5WE86_9BACT|nr:GTPase HflX [Botrimarina hoheduenensis]TWT48463.1 GTPase HflX [Botrimarina hoheduenensis]
MEIDRKQGVASETAVVVGVHLPEHPTLAEEPLDELAGLVESAGAEVVGRLYQRRETPDMTTYIGKGKLGELKQLVEASEADIVVFDNDLSPAQIRNLEEGVGVKVLDRTELILDIFSTRAQTHEARLAVELAQLEYSLPRLKRMWTHLSRLKMGVGMRGPGEKQLETDRRLVEKRISDLKRELDKVLHRKEREVAARSDRMTVSLVGYTNAGKSTLLNRLTASDVYAKDQLFATLDTRTRRWQLPDWGPVLISDTVGFIRDLPHRLIASFKATLEEARQADLLLHVADASSTAAIDQIRAVYDVLAEIGIEQKDTLLILNKADTADDAQLTVLERRYPGSVRVSARTGAGLDRLCLAVSDALSAGFIEADVETSIGNGRLLAYLAKHGEILSRTFTEDRVVVHCRAPQKYLGRIAPEEAEVRPRVRDHGHHPAPAPSPAPLSEGPIDRDPSLEDVA